jgi:hypothetical protein
MIFPTHALHSAPKTAVVSRGTCLETEKVGHQRGVLLRASCDEKVRVGMAK